MNSVICATVRAIIATLADLTARCYSEHLEEYNLQPLVRLPGLCGVTCQTLNNSFALRPDMLIQCLTNHWLWISKQSSHFLSHSKTPILILKSTDCQRPLHCKFLPLYPFPLPLPSSLCLPKQRERQRRTRSLCWICRQWPRAGLSSWADTCFVPGQRAPWPPTRLSTSFTTPVGVRGSGSSYSLAHSQLSMALMVYQQQLS